MEGFAMLAPVFGGHGFGDPDFAFQRLFDAVGDAVGAA
jgi:hypothetical protein